jgi:Dolichyl-phosphate-mannose-protein mannosyltransferase
MIVSGRTAAVLSLVGVAVGLCLWRLLAHTGTYSEGVYWQSLRALAAGHALFSEVFSSQPPLFLLGILPAFDALGHTLVAARTMVAAWSLLALLGTYRAARGIAGRTAGWTAVALLATDPLFAGQSVALLAEVPALALELLCLALAVTAGAARSRRGRLVLAAASGAALSLGLLTKLFVVVVAVPAVPYLLGWHNDADQPAARAEPPADQPQRGLGRQASSLVAFGGALAVITAAALAPFWGRRQALYDQVVGFHLQAARLGYDPVHNTRLLVARGARTPLAWLALAVLALAAWQRLKVLVPPAVWVVASALLLVRLQPLQPNHQVLLAPPLALIAALAPLVASRMGDKRPARTARTPPVPAAAVGGAVVAVVAVVVLGSGISAAQAIHATNRSTAADAQMVAALRAATRPGELVITDDQYLVAAAGRDVPPPLVDTSRTRFVAGYLTAGQLQQAAMAPGVRAVLFAAPPGSARVPAFRRWVQAHFRLYRAFGGTRALYVHDLSR